MESNNWKTSKFRYLDQEDTNTACSVLAMCGLLNICKVTTWKYVCGNFFRIETWRQDV